MSRAPVPLIQGPDLTANERALLEAGRSSLPVEYDVTAGEARLLAGLAALATVGSAASLGSGPGGSPPAAGKGLLIKLGLKGLIGLGVGFALVGGGVVAGRLHAPRAPASARGTHAIPVDVPVAPTVSPPDDAEQGANSPAAIDLPEPSMDEERGRPRRPAFAPARRPLSNPSARTEAVPIPAPPEIPRAHPSEPPPPRVEASDSLAELRAVALARSLLDRDPEGALRVLEKLRRDHATEYFAQERQALTVLALASSGQTAAARQQAAAFLGSFPNGPLSDRVRAVLDDSN